MYFKVAKSKFVEGLNIVVRAVSLNSPLPTLHNVKVSVKENSIQLTASDSDISTLITINNDEETKLEVIRTGELLLDARYFLDMIRKIDSETVEVELVDGCLTKIRGNQVSFDLNGSKVDQYPLIDFSKPSESIKLDSSKLKEIIYQTCFATSDKETRPALTGVNFSINGNKLVCVATDSYRLAQKSLNLNEEHHFNVTIPAKSLNEVSKVLDPNIEIVISLDDKKAVFEVDNVIIQTRLIDGTYPETSRLIPEEFKHELVIDQRDLVNAIDRVSFIKNDGVSVVKLEMSNDEVIITSKSNEVCSVEKVNYVSYTGEPLKITFKGPYVYDAIKALGGYQIKISFCGDMKPFILKTKDNEETLQLVLPIRTY